MCQKLHLAWQYRRNRPSVGSMPMDSDGLLSRWAGQQAAQPSPEQSARWRRLSTRASVSRLSSLSFEATRCICRCIRHLARRSATAVAAVIGERLSLGIAGARSWGTPSTPLGGGESPDTSPIRHSWGACCRSRDERPCFAGSRGGVSGHLLDAPTAIFLPERLQAMFYSSVIYSSQTHDQSPALLPLPPRLPAETAREQTLGKYPGHNSFGASRRHASPRSVAKSTSASSMSTRTAGPRGGN